jgi:alkylation response protein AidB-like acyl-CoA dehydrogenase
MTDSTLTTNLSADELAEFIAVASSFAADVPGKDWAELDVGQAEAIERSWNGIREIGFDRCLVSEEAGGVGLPTAALPPLLEEIATGEGGVAMLMLLSNIAAEAAGDELLAAAGESARLAYLPSVGSRKRDASLPKLTGEKLTGRASFAIGGHAADGYIVACDDGEGSALAYVAVDAAGVSSTRVDDQLALGAARVAKIEFDGAQAVRVGGADAVDHAEALLNAGIAAIARGTARRARALAQEYAENRYQGGTEIINHGAVRDMLARMSERELGMPQPTVGDRELAVGIAAKIAITDAAVLTSLDAIQVFGGMGYMRETGVEKLMRDAKYCQIYPRPNWIARDELLELQR